MRSVLQDQDPAQNIAASLKPAALIGLVLVLPFAVLESLNNTVDGRDAPGLVALFGLLWLLPAAFVVVLAPVVRAARAGRGVTSNPAGLLLRAALSTLIAVTWGVILFDQLPCFMGVPNCD